MCGAGFLRGLLWQQGKPRLAAHCVGSRGPVAVEDSGSGVGGTSDQQVLAKGARTGGISQMGPRAVLASHRRCWVQPGSVPWCLMDTTGRSDHRASSWHGPCLLTRPGLFPGVGSSYPGQKAGSWAPGTHPGTAAITPCPMLSPGQCTTTSAA